MNPRSLSPICEAIARHAGLSFEYDGLPRTVEPYCYGTNSKNNELVRAIQVGGKSRSGAMRSTSGKLWSVAKMKNARVLIEKFDPNDPNYNPDDSAIDQIHCRIEPA